GVPGEGAAQSKTTSQFAPKARCVADLHDRTRTLKLRVVMAETHQIITKVWIAPGCIVCDACENDCPEVFDVQETTCLIRPPAMNPDFLKPLTPSIIVAAEGCPVNVIKFETVEVPGAAPWAGQEAEKAASAPAAGVAHAPAKAPAPMAAPDPRWQALLSTS